MSEAEFNPEGFTPYPHLYADRMRATDVSEWTEAQIRFKLEQYWDFVSQPDVLPRHQEVAQEILGLLGFEVDYRSGFYDRES